MRKRIRLCGALLATVMASLSGGGDDPSGVSLPPPPPVDVLSYSAVAGTWTGTMSTPGGFQSAVSVVLNSSARKGGKVGKVDYAQWRCEMDLLAVEADPPAYQVDEEFVSGPSGCAEGYGFMVHDSGAGTLTYKFVSHSNANDFGTAVLRRP